MKPTQAQLGRERFANLFPRIDDAPAPKPQPRREGRLGVDVELMAELFRAAVAAFDTGDLKDVVDPVRRLRQAGIGIKLSARPSGRPAA